MWKTGIISWCLLSGFFSLDSIATNTLKMDSLGGQLLDIQGFDFTITELGQKIFLIRVREGEYKNNSCQVYVQSIEEAKELIKLIREAEKATCSSATDSRLSRLKLTGDVFPNK